jgi:hypothetical protein
VTDVFVSICGESATKDSKNREGVWYLFMYGPGHLLDLGYYSGIKYTVIANPLRNWSSCPMVDFTYRKSH